VAVVDDDFVILACTVLI